MNYSIDRAGKPAYLQLYEQLRADILSGAYAHGMRMPSKRLLAEELHLSLSTVEHAYVLLCEEGYVEARERSGFYVCFRAGDGFASAPATPPSAPLPAAHAAQQKRPGDSRGCKARALQPFLVGRTQTASKASPLPGEERTVKDSRLS